MDRPESELVEALLRSGRTLAYPLLDLTTPGEIYATLRELSREKVETLALALLAEYEEASSPGS